MTTRQPGPFPWSRGRQDAGDVQTTERGAGHAAFRGKEAKEMQQLVACADALCLRDILPHGRFIGASDIRVRSCSSDPRKCRPGDVYVAIVDADGDGHDEADEAVAGGAIAVVSERLLPVRVPCCVVADTREAYGQICQRLAGQPDRALRLVGVTGTHGKTTTALLITAILRAAQQNVGVTCSLGYSDGATTAAAQTATPPSHDLARWLAQMVTNGCSHGVVEVSSDALATRRLSGVSLDAAVLTNMRREHLDLHGNLDNYRRAKRRLFDHLKPGGFAVINADDVASHTLLESLHVPLITVGMRSFAQVQATVLERCVSEQTFLLTAGQECVPVRTRTIGDQFVYCCLSAAAVGLVMGLDLTTIVRGIETLEYVPGRLERLECGQDFSVFVDHAQTPSALALSLHAIRQVTTKRVICVYGAAHWQDMEQRAAIGRVAERGADIGIITSNNPGHEPPLQIAHDILDGFRNPAKAHIIPDRQKAIHWALSEAQPGDTVIITGKGDELFQTLGSREVHFDDREVACRWLYGTQPKLVDRESTVTLPFRLGPEWN
ncbi:MAG: UDP-N-acetylmuramoyl-L-alanyl-D-glutamate--2,6-diaminopimelate ligase [Planctomycetaceae bacterium]|nr:UDP-N-acetylmuramoyl-L-alanyl-D-glutamate--2,6-diaminopimelate ligase [Planctomycetaceae bacterium]